MWGGGGLRSRPNDDSGTYVDLQRGPDAPHGAWEYLERFIPDSPAKPLRVWTEVAQNDIGGLPHSEIGIDRSPARSAAVLIHG